MMYAGLNSFRILSNGDVEAMGVLPECYVCMLDSTAEAACTL
jgi:hypothetical protein